MYIGQYTLHTALCTLLTSHCTLHTPHCTLHTGNCTPQMAHCKPNRLFTRLESLASSQKGFWRLKFCNSCWFMKPFVMMWCVVIVSLFLFSKKKLCIQETLNLLACADSSTNTKKKHLWRLVYSAPGVKIESIHTNTVVWMHSIWTPGALTNESSGKWSCDRCWPIRGLKINCIVRGRHWHY